MGYTAAVLDSVRRQLAPSKEAMAEAPRSPATAGQGRGHRLPGRAPGLQLGLSRARDGELPHPQARPGAGC